MQAYINTHSFILLPNYSQAKSRACCSYTRTDILVHTRRETYMHTKSFLIALGVKEKHESSGGSVGCSP